MSAVQQQSKSAGASQRNDPLYTWATFAAAIAVLCGFCLKDIPSLLGGGGKDPYRVMGSFWISGWAALRHLNPYGYYPLTWHFYTHPGKLGPVIYDVNLSPPAMLPLFELMAKFPLRADIVVLTILSTLMFLGGTLLLYFARRGQMQKRQIVWLLLSTLVTNTLWFGQDYSVMFLMMCIAWWCIQSNRTTPAAVLIGVLIAMKPNFGLWPLMLFAGGYRRPAFVSAVTAAALSIVPVFIFGPVVYRDWLLADSRIHHYIFAGDMSFIGILTRQGYPLVGVAIAVLAATSFLVFIRRTRPDQATLAGIAICAGIICAPLAWQHYMLFAAPFFATRRWGRLETLAAILIASPILLEGPAMLTGPSFVTLAALPHLAGLYLMLWCFVKTATAQQRKEAYAIA